MTNGQHGTKSGNNNATEVLKLLDECLWCVWRL